MSYVSTACPRGDSWAAGLRDESIGRVSPLPGPALLQKPPEPPCPFYEGPAQDRDEGPGAATVWPPPSRAVTAEDRMEAGCWGHCCLSPVSLPRSLLGCPLAKPMNPPGHWALVIPSSWLSIKQERNPWREPRLTCFGVTEKAPGLRGLWLNWEQFWVEGPQSPGDLWATLSSTRVPAGK